MRSPRVDRSPPDVDSFEAMYRRELAPLVALGLSLTGDREASVDLVHEAMIRTYRAWPAVSEMDRPGAWVRRVLINLVTDRHRRAGREMRAIARLAGRPQAAAAVEPSDRDFWAAVRGLPERQRVAVTLHYLDDRSIDEIAEIMQIAAGTVKSSLFRARQTLATALSVEEVSP